MFSQARVISMVIQVALIAFASAYHEYAHAFVAYKLGDDTAKQAGRLTIKPWAHLDPFGSFVLPLIMLLGGSGILGYAKPVPYSPSKLKHPKVDDALIALAGPLSNGIQALLATLLLLLFVRFVPSGSVLASIVFRVLSLAIYVNLALMFFNLVPVPPLDGSKLIIPFLSDAALKTYYKLQSYALPILFVVLYLLPEFGLNPIGWYFSHTVYPLYDVLISLVW